MPKHKHKSGIGSHHSARSGTDEWLTPPEVLEALGQFDLDPCSPENRPWSTAAHHWTEADDGLSKDWWGRVWLNPPYSRPLIGRFMARMADHGRGTALIFARCETDHFFRHVWEAATGLLFLRGRLYFHTVDGKRARHNAGAPSVLVAYGQEDASVLADCALDGQFVPLRLPRSVAVLAVAAMPTWRDLVADVLRDRGAVRLDDLYRAIERHPKTRGRRHWREKVRQVLQQRGPFERVAPGVWQTKESEASAAAAA